MKNKLIIIFYLGSIVLNSCTNKIQENSVLDETRYVGEYLDSDNNEANLEIAKCENGNYKVQIGIYRLTSLQDGVGELTSDGIKFTATDAADNPISGIITVKNQTATVTFTNSTWDYLKSGSSYKYTKFSDNPKINNE